MHRDQHSTIQMDGQNHKYRPQSDTHHLDRIVVAVAERDAVQACRRDTLSWRSSHRQQLRIHVRQP